MGALSDARCFIYARVGGFELRSLSEEKIIKKDIIFGKGEKNN